MIGWYCVECKKFETTRFFRPKWVCGGGGFAYRHEVWISAVTNGFDFGGYDDCGLVKRTGKQKFEGV